MYQLTNKDVQLINLITGITKTIAIVYERLLFVDFMKEKKDSIMYLDIIKNLKQLVVKEELLYKLLDINYENEDVLWNYFVKSNNLKNFAIEDQFADVCNSDIKSLWKYRVFNRFQDNLPTRIQIVPIDNSDSSFDDDEYIEESDEDIYYIESNKFEELENTIKYDMLRDAINDDFQRAFVYFLGEDIKEETNEFIKDGFSTVRYNILFITPEIEKELLDNNLQNKEELYFGFPMKSCLLQINYNKYKEIQKEEAKAFCLDAIDSMITLEQEEKEDSNFTELNKELFSTYYRTGLSLMYNHNDYKEFIDEVVEESTIDDYSNNSCNDIVEKSLTKIKKDSVKCRYLSL